MVNHSLLVPTISAKVSKKELDAINEYANSFGETVSNLVRKAMIKHITFMDGFERHQEYDVGISVPDNVSGEEDDRIVEGAYNKCRRILGLEEIKL